ncbi:MAG: prolyl oligopeptidase family serine peptidase [Prevotella sp.]|nr:prolyl oligopeptidase family serine peptidase [Prevotella sp.]
MKRIAMTTMMATAATWLTAQTVNYPATMKDNTVDEYFGQKVPDPYRWLEDDRSEQTAQWVEAQNAVTNAYLSRLPQRSKLQKRLTEVANYGKVGTPFWRHGHWYQYRNNGLQNQSVLYTMDELNGEQRVFLDPNTLSADGTVALKSMAFSHDGKHCAYAISRSGSDWMEIYVMDVATRQLTADHIEWCKFSGPQWYKDGFFYSAYDAPEQGKEFSNVNEVQKIYYHKLGTAQKDDVLFYQNPVQPKRFYGVDVTDDETMMFLYESGAGAGNNLFVRDLRQEGSQFIQMTNDMECQYSPVENIGDKIYIFTNYGAAKNRLMVADIRKPGVQDWQELVGETDDVLEDVSFANGKMVLTYSKDACNHVYVYDLQGKRLCEVPLPGVGSVGFSSRKERPECFLTFTSFTQPGTIYQYDMAQNQCQPFAEPKVNFRLSDFQTEQLFFESKDGTRIPMFITYKKGLKRNGRNPVYLYGYGGFNISLPPSFSAMRIPFLESGGIYAQVNLRGGSEYGEEWHLAGTKMQKQNVFDDFIGAAEYLIAQRYTSKDKIAIVGGSNGGLLVGACMTQRPDLFRVAIPQVGVMDMLRYHKFTIGWNWASDYGTSEDSAEMFEYLRGYSPLHNLKPGTSYPATLVTTADHDDRVVPAHSFKFAATLQACNDGTYPTLIRIDTKAGHGGGKPLSKVIEEQADIYGFIMHHLGMKLKK